MAPEPTGPVAAIDCGTNSTRLLVTDPDGVALVRLMRITRLGRGVDATHKLDPEAVHRTIGVLAEFRQTFDRLGARRVRMVATSAVRDAVNGQDFLDAATEVIGSPAELLSGIEEGALAYAGATAGLPSSPGDDVVVDIGGGSTELVLQRSGQIEAVSLDLGCVRLTERHLESDPPTAAELAAAGAMVDAELDRAIRTVGALRTLRPASRLIGLAGTVSTIAALDQGLAEYDWGHLHHYILSDVAVERWVETLAGEPAEGRLARPGMVAGRQDVIVGGALVLRRVMSRFGFAECLVSESDILDGLSASLLAHPGSVAGHRRMPS